VAHTNADAVTPGVSDALAQRLGLLDVEPLDPQAGGPTRVGRLAEPMALADLTAHIAGELPATIAGVRAAGDRDRIITTMAVAGGAGDEFLADAARARVDAYLCADLRHHPASEHLAGGGPALIEAAHWATERPWLDALAEELRSDIGADIIVSDLVTDVWTVHASVHASVHAEKEPNS
jgi:putative NIF3 family GTP cyclohydrolase 1 type 2